MSKKKKSKLGGEWKLVPFRDEYVKISWFNIEPEHAHNFEKKDPEDVSTWDEDYDYGSVMHYSNTAFSRNGEDTITPLV